MLSPFRKWVKKKRAHKDTSFSPLSQSGTKEKKGPRPSKGAAENWAPYCGANEFFLKDDEHIFTPHHDVHECGACD